MTFRHTPQLLGCDVESSPKAVAYVRNAWNAGFVKWKFTPAESANGSPRHSNRRFAFCKSCAVDQWAPMDHNVLVFLWNLSFLWCAAVCRIGQWNFRHLWDFGATVAPSYVICESHIDRKCLSWCLAQSTLNHVCRSLRFDGKLANTLWLKIERNSGKIEVRFAIAVAKAGGQTMAVFTFFRCLQLELNSS